MYIIYIIYIIFIIYYVKHIKDGSLPLSVGGSVSQSASFRLEMGFA